MYDFLLVFFDAKADKTKLDDVIYKMDVMLLEKGWRYSGFRNVYIPKTGEKSDIICDDAVNAIKNAEWLKKYKPKIQVLTNVTACSLKDIHVGNMVFPNKDKLSKYRDYHTTKQKFAHAIVVDENNNLRDGYTTYIIANEEGVEADIIRIDSSVKFKKVVIGKHVVFDGENYVISSDKIYRWYYELDMPVIPGDILLADTKLGKRFMIVERISYVAGTEECSRDKSIKKFVAAS